MLETHVHADHVTSAGRLADRTGASTAASELGAACVATPLRDESHIVLGGVTIYGVRLCGRESHLVLTEDGRQLLKVIEHSADKLAVLSSHLAALADRTPASGCACDRGGWVDAWQTLLCTASFGSTALRVERPPVAVWGMIAPAAAQDALLHIVCNAAESNATLVTVRCGTMSVGEALGPDLNGDSPERMLAYIEVEDNGSGIATAELWRVFQPFYSTKDSGRGLGLSLALSGLRRMGGGIRVESVEAHGTRVRLLFSACTKKASYQNEP